ncbi:MAG: hypothetical protein NC342_08920 [Pseudoflavonifractor sp.]|nr:hypothetical protein [Pseudoflavonifractor sp.]
MGMSRADFLAMTPAEFEAAARAWNEAEEARDRAAWLRVRRLAAILIRPHIKRAIPEEQLIPLKGDRRKPPRRKEATPAEVTDKRVEAFRRKLSTGTNGPGYIS